MFKRLSIIAKPTHDCNLRCKYCYIEPSAEKGKMSESLLAQSIEKVSDFAEKSHWIWHGGEPLIMGLDFYKIVKDIQDFYKKKGKKFSNGIQTNGTLITSEIINFCKQTKDFFIGMSLDGPEEINNRTRIYPDEKGSFKQVMKAKSLLKGKKVGGGIICVITNQNIYEPEKLYSFFKSIRTNIKFNPLIYSERVSDNKDSLEISPKEYGKFLIKMWEIYNKDVEKDKELKIEIDPFIQVLGNLGTNSPLGCNYSKSCRNDFISIGPEGDIYPCGRFDGIKEFWMGNIKTNTIEEMVNSSVNIKLKKRSLENVSTCLKCKNGGICNSGCMHNAYCAGDVLGKDPYCLSYKILFKKMEEVISNEPSVKKIQYQISKKINTSFNYK